MNKILDILKLTNDEKEKGVWFSGEWGEGEYKKWYRTGLLSLHSFWKKGQRHGEFKEWWITGQLIGHSFWKNGNKIKDYFDEQYK